MTTLASPPSFFHLSMLTLPLSLEIYQFASWSYGQILSTGQQEKDLLLDDHWMGEHLKRGCLSFPYYNS